LPPQTRFGFDATQSWLVLAQVEVLVPVPVQIHQEILVETIAIVIEQIATGKEETSTRKIKMS
jgi:hypothetical protein